MPTFAEAVKNEKDNLMTRTTNGMAAHDNTKSKLLDFFTEVGSARGRDMSGMFAAAFAEDEEYAIRTLLWTRDARGGAGERKLFRDLMVQLESYNADLALRLLPKIPFLGRWDDVLYSYKLQVNRDKVFEFIKEALDNGDGLCAKWMPRKGPVAAELRNALGMTPKQYRKTLVSLTNVVETQMCAKDWDNINFSHVPSLAAARYQKAFGKNAPTAYSAYIAELQKKPEDRDPKVKINAGAVYPYDVVRSIDKGNPSVADAQWEAMPNFMGDAKALPMVDVSGSMQFRIAPNLSALDLSLSLGLYCSSKTSSAFKDMFLTFSASPKIEVLKGTLSQKLKQLRASDGWGMNTNLHAAFDEVLRVAKKNKVSQEDMPDYILIMSDMQFDGGWGAACRYDETAMQMIRRKFREAGYKMPGIVFWNLTGGEYKGTPVQTDSRGVVMVSGFSPSIMASVLGANPDDYTPEAMMRKTLDSDRYDY